MEYSRCRAIGCELDAVFRCEKSHDDLLLCSRHFDMHQGECQYAAARTLHNSRTAKKLVYGLDGCGKLLMVDLMGKALLLQAEAVDVHVPADYAEALRAASSILADAVLALPNGAAEKIRKACVEFRKAVQKTILNLEIGIDKLAEKLSKVYAEYHSKREGSIASGLYRLIEAAEKSLGMKKKATKNLVFTIELEAVREGFIAKYFTRDLIDFAELLRDFEVTFEPFVTNPRNLQKVFENFEVQFKNESEKLRRETRMDLCSAAVNAWEALDFLRLGVFAYEYSSGERVINVARERIMLVGLFLAKSSVSLLSAVSLSSESLLLAVGVGSEAYLLHFHRGQAFLVQVLPTTDIVLASGSTPCSIVIYNNTSKVCQAYELVNSRLELRQTIKLFLDPAETVTHLALIPDLNKLVFLANSRTVSSLIIGEFRVRINIDFLGEACLEVRYFRQRGILCAKSANWVVIMNKYLQKVAQSDLIGREMTLIENESSELCLLVEHNSNLVAFSTSIQAVSESTSENFRYRPPTPCQYCVGVDLENIPENERKSIYAPTYTRRFMIPDLHVDFDVALKKSS
jgi:hypothetical protein